MTDKTLGKYERTTTGCKCIDDIPAVLGGGTDVRKSVAQKWRDRAIAAEQDRDRYRDDADGWKATAESWQASAEEWEARAVKAETEKRNPAHGVDWQEIAERHEDTISDLFRERDDALSMAHLWKETTRRNIRRRQSLTDMYAGAFEQMETRAENAEEERHKLRATRRILLGRIDALEAELADTYDPPRAELIKRVEMAKRGRSDARAEREALEDTISNLEDEVSELRAQATMREARIEDLRDTIAMLEAAEPRPLTPADITAEDVTTDPEITHRAMAVLHRVGYMASEATVADALRAALTVPTRPEGAEKIEALIDRAGTEGEGGDNESLADYLTRCGVRAPEDGAA